MNFRPLYLSLLLLFQRSTADLHTYCGCQHGTNQGLDFDATKSVADNECNPLVWAPIAYQPHDDLHWAGGKVRWPGAYLQCADGSKCIDGLDFVRQCKKHNPNADGACLECNGIPQQSPGRIQCN
ncbi:hypothetical protein Cob_v008823 [Colletotrichum orbiculare MAFF 240422]|uniref:Secreted protein n=1 Tax=Colletotrichum orbiculare (strain 104-T / ATCC 96160 / CBS 514.97 / LARS 414 / MAFF 240422) TaxID=1213857 RepID=A0A484FHX3_COLOR|nr:hypothetical protein Cob_v008823 [Colletotrichum orbiculare MAFF 240422]